MAATHTRQQVDWPAYGGSAADDRYSPLQQINRSNVHALKMVWRFDVGNEGGLQTNPLIVGRVLYGYTPTQQVFALDAATGKQLWTFDDGIPGLQPVRGLTYWADGQHRVLFAGPGERIELAHLAEDRAIFARGAIKAAAWLVGCAPGRYRMEDVLGL